MAFNFSKIVRSVEKASNTIAQVESLTRAASNFNTGIPLKSNATFPTANSLGIRQSIGSFDNVISANSFSQTNLSNSVTAAFNPAALNSLVSSPGDVGNAAAAAREVSQVISGISNRTTFDVNSGLSSNLGKLTSNLGSLQNITGTLSRVTSQFGSTINSISSKVSSLSNFSFGGLGSIVSSFGDFGKLVENVITVVPRSIAELQGAVGGEFDRLRQLADAQLDTSGITGDFLDLGFSDPWGGPTISGSGVASNSGNSASKIPNPLRDYASHNYIITLGILDQDEFNYPQSYRNGDFNQKIILKSAGGQLDKRYKTALEGTDNAEYYLDNLDLDAVIAPNPKTNVALGTSLTFEVTEPYSMGQFIEAIIGIAAELGYANYTDAPFCLKIEFAGWSQEGSNATLVTPPIYIPILITKVDFSVSGKGSVYNVTAVPMTETGLDDKVQETQVNINAVGSVVYEVANGDEKSIQATYNERIQELEQAKTIEQGDRYIIAFPKTPDAIVNLVNGQGGASSGPLTVQADEQQRREKGLASAQTDESTQRKQAGIDDNAVAAPSNLFTILKSFVSSDQNTNDIGLSPLVENTSEGGEQPQAEQEAAYDEFGDIVDISNNETAVSEKGRTHSFEQGEKITDILQTLILRSSWAKERATEESKNGVRKWFKIDTQVFLDKNAAASGQTGKTPKIFVYSILPYYVDEAKFMGPSSRPKNTEGLKKQAAKEYNYIYTGKNEDVLDFDLQFNNAFFMSAFGNFGQNTGSVALQGGNKATFQQGDDEHGSKAEGSGGNFREPGATIKETTSMRHVAGSLTSDIKTRIAEQFHNTIINSVTDMVTAEMKIWGDPFFLPQQTGNFTGTATGNPNVLQEQTMNYLQNEVFCVVNFKTPFDYQQNGATMEFPSTVPHFSGLYSIWAVTNSFSGGQFTQLIKLIRRRGQDDPATGSSNPIQPDSNADIAKTKDTTPGTAGGASGSGSASNAVNSTAGVTEPCATTSAVAAVQNLSSIATNQQAMALEAFGGSGPISAPVVRVGDFSYTPNQSVFPVAPRVNNYSESTSKSSPTSAQNQYSESYLKTGGPQ